MPASSPASDLDSESPRHSDASMSVSDWSPEPRLRGLRWRVLLGVLPHGPTSIEALRRAAANSRRRYAELRRRLIVDPHTREDVQKGENLNVDNPLSQDPDSIWGHYFKNTELEKTIENDLTRLYPEHGSYFQGLSCQSMLKRILLVWVLSHTQYGYRQGMHELLAPLVYVLHLDVTHLSQVRQRYEDPFEDRYDTPHEDRFSSNRESSQMAGSFSARSTLNLWEDSDEWIHKVHPDDLALVEPDDFGFNLKTMLLGSDSYGAEGELGALLSRRFLEHDAYCMFDALLGGHNGEVALADYFLAATEGKTGISSVLEASASMYHTLVIVDAPLYTHLVEIGVEPQFFALRWFRVLFGREFDLEMLLHLWDAIFSASYSDEAKVTEGKDKGDKSKISTRAAFISTFAVSMILYLRSSLLTAPNATACLQKLLNFPKHVDVRSLIKNTKALQRLSEEASGSLALSAAKEACCSNRSRTSGLKNGTTRTPSFHMYTTPPSKGLQHLHSNSPDVSSHCRTESYWEERWMSSILTEGASKELPADAVNNRSISASDNNTSTVRIVENTAAVSSSQECSVAPAESSKKVTKRSLFASFFKGAAQLWSSEDKKPDATGGSLEVENSSKVEVPVDANSRVQEEAEPSISSDAKPRLEKEDLNAGFGSTGGSEAGASDMWTSDDGETSSSGDEDGKLLSNPNRAEGESGEACLHPPQAIKCLRTPSDGCSCEDSEHVCGGMDDVAVCSFLQEADRGLENEPEPKVTKEKPCNAVLQTLGQSMVESIQVIEGALSSLTLMDGASTAYRETAENLSKALLNGKGHLSALSALAELRKISSILLQM